MKWAAVDFERAIESGHKLVDRYPTTDKALRRSAWVTVGAVVATGLAAKTMDPRLGGLPGEVAALAIAAAFCFFLYRAGRS